MAFFCHVGQAGVQLGRAFWAYAVRQCDQDPQLASQLMYHDQPRCLWTDSDPRVLERVPAWCDEQKVLLNVHGCAGCWGVGFTVSPDPVITKLITETKKLPFLDTIYVFHSTTGGTGGGFGSRLLQALRRSFGYPIRVISVAVAPFEEETPLQNINSMLSLRYCAEYAHRTLLFSNQSIQLLLQRANPRTSGAISLKEINRYIVRCLWLFHRALRQGMCLDFQRPFLTVTCSITDPSLQSRALTSSVARRWSDVCAQAAKMVERGFEGQVDRRSAEQVKVVLVGPLAHDPQKTADVRALARAVRVLAGGESRMQLAVSHDGWHFAADATSGEIIYLPCEYALNGGGAHARADTVVQCSLLVSDRVLIGPLCKVTRELIESGAYMHYFSACGMDVQFLRQCCGEVEGILRTYT